MGRVMTRALGTGVALLALCASVARSQVVELGVAVHGAAFDSLRGAPLRMALLNLGGSGRTAISDDSGRFRFDSVAPGRYTLLMQHDALDSLGIAAVRHEFTVSDGRELVRIAIPSFNTLWRRACGGAQAPRDSGFVFGSVRDARTGAPVSDASLAATWSDIGFDGKQGVIETRMGGSVATDGEGNYLVCGVPNDVTILIRVGAALYSDALFTIAHVAPGVTRQDVLLRSAADSSRRGTVRGVVRNESGQPAPRVRVGTEFTPEVETGADGRFLIANVPIGALELRVRALGATPFVAVVNVSATDTGYVELGLNKMTVLETVRVSAASLVTQRFVRDLEERRARGFGKFADSISVDRRNTIMASLMTMANIKVSARGGISFGALCGTPVLWIDRRQVPNEDVSYELRTMHVARVGMIEIYEHRGLVPVEFWPKGEAPCAVIVIWTKWMFP